MGLTILMYCTIGAQLLPEYTTFVFSFQARRLLEDSLSPLVHNIMAVVGLVMGICA